MNIKLENMFRFLSAEANVHPGINFVTGQNSSGKTSFATCLSALTTHESNPLGLSVSQVKRYVRDGENDGVAVLRDGDMEVRWQPPNKVAHAPDTLPLSGLHATGGMDFVAPMQAKARATMWESLFVPDNPRAVLEASWPEGYKEHLPIVAKMIEEHGWESALKLYTEQRKDAKNRWEQVAGQRYGSNIANSWVPEGWSTSLAPRSVESLTEALQTAKDALHALESQEAITEEMLVRAEEAREKAKQLKHQRFELNKSKKEMNDALEEIRNDPFYLDYKSRFKIKKKEIEEIEQYQENPQDECEYVAFNCPDCTRGLFELIAVPAKDQSEVLDMRKREREALKEEFMEIFGNKIKKYETEIEELKKKIQALSIEEMAELTLAQRYAGERVREIDEEALEKARNEVDTIKIELAAKVSYDNAKRHHEAVQLADVFCKILGPQGARTILMQKNMELVRKSLQSITKATGWLPIKILEDYSITSGDRPVQLCAANEQLKAQWALQIATALVLKSKVVILDNADTLRGKHWQGLIDMATRIGEKFSQMTVVICATENHDGVPDNWHVVDLGKV